MLLRPVLAFLGLLLAGGAGYALAHSQPNPVAEAALLIGGWIMIGLLGLVSLATLGSSLVRAVFHLQDRGHGAPPSEAE